jgi:CRISPR system Cascade subunit CasA
MILGNGFRYLSFAKGGPSETTAIVVANPHGKKDERRLLSYRPGRALWRELAAIVVKRNAEGLGGPLGLRSLAEGDACDLIVTALARKQATVLDTTEAVYPIPPRLRSTAGRNVYEAEVQRAENLEQRLGWAVEEYRRTLDGDWDKRLERAGPDKPKVQARMRSLATTHYWTNLEKRLGLLLNHLDALGTESAVSTRDAWRALVWASARDAYKVACGQETPREIRAFAAGWKKLTHEDGEDKKKTRKKGAPK